jgi:hypothetical protein
MNGDIQKAAELTGYTEQQILNWFDGTLCPQKQTIEYFLHRMFVPEFKVVIEFGEFDSDKEVRPQLRKIFEGHEQNAGIYAFYDSMANLLYVGKATHLLEECYSAIRRNIPVTFPAGIKKKPDKRHEVVRYISAYDVGQSNYVDYPKHVESLILRISKPILNKKIGHLDKAYAQPKEN